MMDKISSACTCGEEQPKPKFTSVYGEAIEPRTGGFDGPLDTLQRSAWLVIVLLSVTYWFLCAWFMPWPQAPILTILYLFTSGFITVAKSSVSMMSNEPDVLYEPQLTDRGFSHPPNGIPRGCRGCGHCRQFVPESCKHCRVCDKCVVGFDHHCRWLNTCVGSKNYNAFFTFVLSTTLGMMFQAGVGLYVLVLCFTQQDFIRSRERLVYGYDALPAHIVFLIIVIAIEIAFVFPIGYLLQFHSRLIYNGQTTWELIKEKRERKARAAAEEKRLQDEQRKAQELQTISSS